MYDIKIYQDQAKTHYNYQVLENDQVVAGNIGYPTEKAAWVAANLKIGELAAKRISRNWRP
jgi:hypothetical protein